MKRGDLYLHDETDSLVKICYIGENEIITIPQVDGKYSHEHKSYSFEEFTQSHTEVPSDYIKVEKRGRGKHEY